jgi:hypothetical protein
MNMMNKVFMEKIDKCVVVFIDDILVFSETAEEHEVHEVHLRMVLGKLKQRSCMPSSASVSSGWRKSPFSVTCCQLKEWP